jgi:hypothetical protein
MNPSNARRNTLRIVVALVTTGLLVAVVLEKRLVPRGSASKLTTSDSVTAEGENEQRHSGQIEAQGAKPTPPDWALYGSYEEMKPIPGETYPDFAPRGPRASNSSPAAGIHVPE